MCPTPRFAPRFALAALPLAALLAGLTIAEAPALALPESEMSRDTLAKRRISQLDKLEMPLRQARAALPECAQGGCLTPSEAAAIAVSAGPERTTRGRFVLDVRGGGPGEAGVLRRDGVFFLNSERDFRQFGVLTLAITPEALGGLLGQPAVTGEGKPDHRAVKAMMARFAGKRLIVDGEIGLQKIELVDWITNQRNGEAYYQAWVRITSPDQIRVVEG